MMAAPAHTVPKTLPLEPDVSIRCALRTLSRRLRLMSSARLISFLVEQLPTPTTVRPSRVAARVNDLWNAQLRMQIRISQLARPPDCGLAPRCVGMTAAEVIGQIGDVYARSSQKDVDLLSPAEVLNSLLTSKKKAKIRKAVKRTPDPDEQVRLGSSVVSELMIRVSDGFGSKWIADHDDGIDDGICEAARVLLLGLDFEELVAMVARSMVAIVLRKTSDREKLRQLENELEDLRVRCPKTRPAVQWRAVFSQMVLPRLVGKGGPCKACAHA